MGYVVRMPKLGLEMEQGTVLEWAIEEGEEVEEGDLVAEIESEKSIGEVEARESGVLRTVYVDVEETVPPGTPMGIVAPVDEDVSELESEAEADLEGEAAAESEATVSEGEASASESASADESASTDTSASADASASAAASESAASESVKASPRAERRAEELGVELTGVEGTGPQGAITADDVEVAAEAADESEAAVSGSVSTDESPTAPEDVKASPRAERRAEELGVDLTTVEGTGPQGAITADDVEGAAAAASAPAESESEAVGELAWADDATDAHRYDRETAVAGVSTGAALLETVEGVRNAFEEEVAMADVLVVLAAETLAACPECNATYAESTHQLRESVDVALVDDSDGELTAGVVIGAERRSLGGIVDARRGLTASNEGDGATFTLATDPEGDATRRLLNPPAVASLVVDSSGKRARPAGDGVDLEPLVTASLTYDTRALDADDARQFLDLFFATAERASEVVLSTYRGIDA
jgi:pyruvate dehydrogenase E2 component (dihydrolipoamide acetyltransferase)